MKKKKKKNMNLLAATPVINKQAPSVDADCFRDAFKYYKRRRPPPNFDRVFDFTKGASEKVCVHSFPIIARIAVRVPVISVAINFGSQHSDLSPERLNETAPQVDANTLNAAPYI